MSKEFSKVISISNHKGGVGKTTSVVNIGAGISNFRKDELLTKSAYKVLLIDLDPQANLTQSLGVSDPETTIYGAIKGEYKIQPIKISPLLHLVPSSLDLSGAEVELSGEPGREFILRELIEPLRDEYEYILIDTPPSLGLLTINSFVASDEIYIPIQAHYLALQGLTKLTEVIEKIKKRLNKELELGGVFITMYDRRKVLSLQIAQALVKNLGSKVFKTKIRENIALAEAPTKGEDIYTYAPKSNGAEDYRALCLEIVTKYKGKRSTHYRNK